jgi:hypothetical protein
VVWHRRVVGTQNLIDKGEEMFTRDTFPVIDVTCPECRVRFKVYGPNTVEEAEDCTTDCYGCDALLIFIKGEVVEFHGHMRTVHPEWNESNVLIFEGGEA